MKLSDEALRIYKKALQLDDKNFESLKCLAWHYFLLKDYKDTLEVMSNFEETDVERDFDCLFMIAKCFEAQNLAKEAFKSYNKALRICTTDAVVLCSLGVMLYKYKYPQEAFNLFQQSYQLDPSLLESLYNMGIIYENCKFYTEALFIYNKLLQINPDDSFVLRKKSTLEHGKLEANDD